VAPAEIATARLRYRASKSPICTVAGQPAQDIGSVAVGANIPAVWGEGQQIDRSK
jgi:hypothetical protein